MDRFDWLRSKVFGRILDIGCNKGDLLRGTPFAPNTMGCDLDTWEVPYGLGFKQADAHELPFKDGEFNCSLLGEILEHVKDPVKVLKEARRVVNGYVVLTVPNEYCYDDKTEVLTLDGFKYFKELEMTDEIATMNQKTGYLVYHRPTRIIHNKHNGPMIKFKGALYDLCVTPNHRMWVRKSSYAHYHGDMSFGFMDAAEVYNRCHSDIEMCKYANWVGEEQKWFNLGGRRVRMDDWLRFLGWYISEGSRYYYAKRRMYCVFIGQRKEVNRPKIMSIVQRLGLHASLNKNGITIYSKMLYNFLAPIGKTKEGTIHVPGYVKRLCKRQLWVFFECLMAGDGHWTKRKGGGAFYITKTKKLVDDVMEILLKLGWCGSYTRCHSELGSWYSVSINRYKLTPRIEGKVSKIHYQGDVWCVTVPNHLIYVRRNGKCVWCGNSWHPDLRPMMSLEDRIKADNTTYDAIIKHNTTDRPECKGITDDKVNPHLWHVRNYTLDTLTEDIEKAGLRYKIEMLSYDGWCFFVGILK